MAESNLRMDDPSLGSKPGVQTRSKANNSQEQEDAVSFSKKFLGQSDEVNCEELSSGRGKKMNDLSGSQKAPPSALLKSYSEAFLENVRVTYLEGEFKNAHLFSTGYGVFS